MPVPRPPTDHCAWPPPLGSLCSLPAELAEALKAGKLPPEILQRFLDMDANPFLSWLMKMGCGRGGGGGCGGATAAALWL